MILRQYKFLNNTEFTNPFYFILFINVYLCNLNFIKLNKNKKTTIFLLTYYIYSGKRLR